MRCESTGNEFGVIKTTLHSDYARRVPEIQRAAEVMIARGERLDAAQRDGSKLLVQFEAEFTAAAAELGRAAEQCSFFDLGSLTVAETLPVRLPIAPIDTVDSLKRPISVLGGASASNSAESDRLAVPPQWLTCDRGAMLTGGQDDDRLVRWQ